MTRALVARRLVTMIGVALLVVVGFAAIRAAAVWTAAAAPLQIPPASASSLQGAIADEQARSAALRDALDSLAAQTDDLATALDQARARMTTDTRHAHDLSTQLSSAQRQLAKIEAAIQRARRALAPSASSGIGRGSGSGSTPTGGGGGGGEGSDDGLEREGG